MVKKVGDRFFIAVAPQRGKYDIEEAAKGGINLLINHRPDDDSTGGNDLLTMSSAEIEAQARAAGMDYIHIPVVPAQISDDQITATAEAIKQAGNGYILATCRTGMRALIMYSLAPSKNRCGEARGHDRNGEDDGLRPDGISRTNDSVDQSPHRGGKS
jgi:uncharacterized protein (TIGR01244 family)